MSGLALLYDMNRLLGVTCLCGEPQSDMDVECVLPKMQESSAAERTECLYNGISILQYDICIHYFKKRSAQSCLCVRDYVIVTHKHTHTQ